MTKEERAKIYQALSAPFAENCVERTSGQVTGKGYSTTGIKYQHVVNRLNEVLGVGGWRTERTISVKEVTTSRGRPAFEAICAIKIELGEWQDGKFVTFADAVGDGGHLSISEADARKGAFTNSLKKAAAFFGCGRQAYEGSIDDDNAPNDEPIDYAPTQRAADALKARSAPKPQARNSKTPPQPNERESPKTAPQEPPPRRRLTSDQLAAIWKIVEVRGWPKSHFRDRVKAEYGVAVEFLTSEQASRLLEIVNGNGHDHQAGARQS